MRQVHLVKTKLLQAAGLFAIYYMTVGHVNR